MTSLREREIFKICMDGLSLITTSYFLRSLSIGLILLMMCIVGNLVEERERENKTKSAGKDYNLNKHREAGVYKSIIVILCATSCQKQVHLFDFIAP